MRVSESQWSVGEWVSLYYERKDMTGWMEALKAIPSFDHQATENRTVDLKKQ